MQIKNLSHIRSSLGHHRRRHRILIICLFLYAVIHKKHMTRCFYFRWLTNLIELRWFHLGGPLGKCYILLGFISLFKEILLFFHLGLYRLEFMTISAHSPFLIWRSSNVERIIAHLWNRRCQLRINKVIVSPFSLINSNWW